MLGCAADSHPAGIRFLGAGFGGGTIRLPLLAVFESGICMPLTISCPQCRKSYRVGDQTAGKQVRCQQCSTVFVAQPAAAKQDSLAEIAALPAAPNPLGAAVATRPGAPAIAGPSDAAMRLASAGLTVLGLVMLVATFVMDQSQGMIYLMPLAIAPLGLILGIAGLISPNVVRAAGKYGGHLSWHYKATAWALMGLCLVVTLLLLGWVLSSGYRPA